MRVVGLVPLGFRAPGVDCDRPVRAVCRDCDQGAYWRCDTYRCGPCGETKRRRLQRLIEDGSTQHLGKGLRGYFLTLTAPGTADHSVWYQGKRPSRRRQCQCHRHGLTDGEWNRQESACWNRLRTSLTRSRTMAYVGAVETQERGLLHRHLVLITDVPLEYSEVQQLALAAGYGCVLDIEPLQSAAKAGRYLAKYVTKSTADRPDVPWTTVHVDHDTGEVTERQRRATFRLWSASHRWGVTMKEIKAVAQAQAAARARYHRELVAALADEQGQADGSQPVSAGADPP